MISGSSNENTSLFFPLLPFFFFFFGASRSSSSSSIGLSAAGSCLREVFIASGVPETSAGSFVSASSHEDASFFFPLLPFFSFFDASRSSSSSSIGLSAAGSCLREVFIASGVPETSAGSIVSASSHEDASFFFPFLPFFFFGASQSSRSSSIGLSVPVSSMPVDTNMTSLLTSAADSALSSIAKMSCTA